MITRGHLIGGIVDDLSDLAGRIDVRCKLGLTDLNVHVENFYREILSAAYGINLKNLNSTRSNEPGLDLGDDRAGMAFQVTSQKTSAKVNDTLKKLSGAQLKAYPKTHVFVVVRKQTSYSLDAAECGRCSFDQSQIVDYMDLCRMLMNADAEVLQRTYETCRREMRRVMIELEIPDEQGNYPTSASSLAERIPQPRIGNGKAFCQYMLDEALEEDYDEASIVQVLSDLSARLQKLPRITRDTFALMIERRETESGGTFYPRPQINMDKLDRIFSGYDIHAEVRILQGDGFVDPDEPEERHQSWMLGMYLPGTPDYFFDTFLDFTKGLGVSIRKPLVSLDFSDF